jgi:hypothetical protein
MWITRHIFGRTLVWLTAVTLPVQGLPAAHCGCISSGQSLKTNGESPDCCAGNLIATNRPEINCCSEPSAGRCPCTGAEVCRCGETSSCCQQRLACCSAGDASGSSCQCGTGCQCGDNCQCGKNNVPAEPAIPPVENSSPERILADSVGAAAFVTFYLPATTRQRLDLHAGADALTALDCCVALCRFTL